jgi:hypothetical protein
MAESAHEPEAASLQMSTQLLDYYDEFAEFSDRCAFLCDAFAAIAAHNESLDEHSVRGLAYSADWLKCRARELKEKLRTIQRSSR